MLVTGVDPTAKFISSAARLVTTSSLALSLANVIIVASLGGQAVGDPDIRPPTLQTKFGIC